MAMTWAPLMPYWPWPATFSSLSSCLRRLRLRSSLPSSALRAAFSCSRRARRSWRSPESRIAETALPIGSTALDTPFSIGPKTVAAAPRAPSTGESSPPRMSTVISANAMAISSTRSSRRSRVSLTCGGRAFLVEIGCVENGSEVWMFGCAGGAVVRVVRWCGCSAPVRTVRPVVGAYASISTIRRTRGDRPVRRNQNVVSSARLGVQHLLQRLELLDALAGAERHAVQRVLGDVDRHAGLTAQPFVEAAQQRSAAGQDDAPVHDVAGQLRRAFVEGRLHGVHDGVDGLLDRLAHFGGGDDDGLGQPGDEVPAADLGVLVGVQVVRRTDRDLDLFGRPLTQQQRVLLLDVLDDRVVQLVARDADGLGGDDAAEGADRDLRGAAADVHHHRARGPVGRQAGTDGSGDGLLEDVQLTGAGLGRGLDDGAALDAGEARGHTDDSPRTSQIPPLVDLQDEVAEHPLGDLEVGDDAVLQRTHGDDVSRRATDHLLRFGTDREDATGIGVDRYDGRLVEYDPATPDVHQRVGGPEVDSHVTADERH